MHKTDGRQAGFAPPARIDAPTLSTLKQLLLRCDAFCRQPAAATQSGDCAALLAALQAMQRQLLPAQAASVPYPEPWMDRVDALRLLADPAQVIPRRRHASARRRRR